MLSCLQLYYIIVFIITIIIFSILNYCVLDTSFLPSGVVVGAGMVVGTENNENEWTPIQVYIFWVRKTKNFLFNWYYKHFGLIFFVSQEVLIIIIIIIVIIIIVIIIIINTVSYNLMNITNSNLQAMLSVFEWL